MYLNLDYFFYKIYSFFATIFNFIMGREDSFLGFLSQLKVVAIVFSVLFLLGIIYNYVVLFKFKKKQLVEFAKTIIEEMPDERVTRWDKIKKYLDSESSSDWHRAVLEADSLMDDIIKKIGYKGETFGERLTQIKPAQFGSLQEIWEAHKIRNRIAHEGEKFELTKSEAERALDFYEKALKELEYL